MILGILLIIGGILIAVYPPLLSMIVAFLLIFSGIMLLTVGYRFKKMSKSFNDPFLDFFMKF